jgi:hypothetical protein
MGTPISSEDLNDIAIGFKENRQSYKKLLINFSISALILLMFLCNIINIMWAIFIVLAKDIFWAFYPFHNSDTIHKICERDFNERNIKKIIG